MIKHARVGVPGRGTFELKFIPPSLLPCTIESSADIDDDDVDEQR